MINTIIILYLIVTIISIFSLFTIRAESFKKYLFLLIGILLILFTGLRNKSIFRDYGEYVYMFTHSYKYIEPSFKIISYFIHHILNSNPIYLFIIYGFIAITIKLYSIRKLSNFVFLSLLIYVADLYMLQENTQIRVAVSTGFLLLCIDPIYNRNKSLFLLYSSFAIFFHYSAILILVLWFINAKKINKNIYIAILVVSYVLAILKLDIIQLIGLIPISPIQNKYEFYKHLSDSGDGANIFSIYFLCKVGLFLIFLWKADLLYQYNKYAYIFIKIMAISLFSLLLFSRNIAAGLRISELFSIINIVLFPLLLYIIQPRFMTRGLLIAFSFLILYIRVFYSQLLISY